MHFPKLGLLILGITMISGAGLVGVSPVHSENRNCPNYQDALYNLNQAQFALKRAAGNAEGQRLDAYQDIERAKTNVRQAMRIKNCRM